MKGKSIVWIVLAVMLVALTVVGIIFGVNYFKNKNNAQTSDGIATAYEVKYFSDNQSADKLGVIQVYAVGEDFTSITYKIDNGAEVTFKANSVAATEDWEFYKAEYKDLRCIDTGVVTIDLSSLEAGDHIITIKVYNGEESQELAKNIFNLKAAQAA